MCLGWQRRRSHVDIHNRIRLALRRDLHPHVWRNVGGARGDCGVDVEVYAICINLLKRGKYAFGVFARFLDDVCVSFVSIQ